MSQQPFFFFLLLLICNIPLASAVTNLSATVLGEGEVGNTNDEIVLDNNTTADLSHAVEVIPDSTVVPDNIGGQDVTLTQQVTFVATENDNLNLENSQLTSVLVTIPDLTVMFAPDNWDEQLSPPKSVTTIPIEVSGFITPTTAIQVGSPDVILVFNQAVTIILTGTTGQTAYKIPGGTEWILISTCTGTFANPNDPPLNGECSISNEVDTKILTYHFTEFTGLSTPAPSTPSTPSTGGGGSGNVGVGSPRIFGPGSSGGGSSGGGDYTPTQRGQTVFPAWFDNVKDWYRMGDISAIEFLNAYQWIINNL